MHAVEKSKSSSLIKTLQAFISYYSNVMNITVN